MTLTELPRAVATVGSRVVRFGTPLGDTSTGEVGHRHRPTQQQHRLGTSKSGIIRPRYFFKLVINNNYFIARTSALTIGEYLQYCKEEKEEEEEEHIELPVIVVVVVVLIIVSQTRESRHATVSPTQRHSHGIASA
jgi:hypothetical protein